LIELEPLVSIKRLFGVNPLDPEQLDEAGFAADQPVAMAMIDPKNEVWCLAATLTDAGRLARFATLQAQKEGLSLRRKRVGDAVILASEAQDKAVALVIHPNHAYLVLSGDRGNRIVAGQPLYHHVMKIAASMAKHVPGTSGALTSSASFGALRDGIGTGRDVAGVMLLDTAWSDIMVDLNEELATAAQRHKEELVALQAELTLSKMQGDVDNELRIEADIADRKQWHQRSLTRTREAMTRIETLGKPIQGLGVGLRAHAVGVALDLHVVLAPGSLPARLMRLSGSRPMLLNTLTRQPFFVLEGRADPTAFIEVLELLFGELLQEARGNASFVPGFDLDRDVLQRLDGELGMAAGGDWQLLAEREEDKGEKAFWNSFFFHLLVGFQDPTHAQQLFDTLTTWGRTLGGLKKSPLRGGVQFDMPLGERPFHFAVAGHYLTLSTDPAWIERVRKQARGGDFATQLEGDVVRNIVGVEQSGGTFLFEPSIFSAMMYRDALIMSDYGGSYYDLPETLPAHHPNAAQFAEQRRVLDALNAKIDAANAEIHRMRRDGIDLMLSRLGTIVLAADMHAHQGWRVRGGFVLEPDELRSFMDRMVHFTRIEAERERREEALEVLRQDRRDLEALLDELRR